jgi:hypothetical protein
MLSLVEAAPSLDESAVINMSICQHRIAFWVMKLSELKLIGLSRYRQMLLSRIKMKVLLALPEKLKQISFYGSSFYCPVCKSHIREYERFGHMEKAWCPVCGSMRWQRFAWCFWLKIPRFLMKLQKSFCI